MIVLGADVGGSSTRVVLFDDGTPRDRAELAGGSMRRGEGRRVAELVADLARPLLMRSRAVRADTLVVGAAGAGRESERRELQESLEMQRLAWRVVVTTDAELARAAAFEGAAGVLVIAGTGSIAIARDRNGETRRIGGLGWRMGDQGSAYWIVARALEAVGAMHDGSGTVTHLAEALCAGAHLPGIAGLVQWSTTATASEVAALCPAVISCAANGDPVAEGIRDEAVRELVHLAVAAGALSLPVAMSGALLRPDGPLHDRVATLLEHRGVIVSRRAVDPCRGAPVLARS